MRPNTLFVRPVARLLAGLIAALTLSAGATLLAQIPGRNVNMVAGTEWPEGDPFLQRQNEPSIAASTRNPLHLVGGSNDYRTVDVPGLPNDAETGDAWLSVYKSFDGGQRWSSTLLPGYPQDTSAAGMASPIKGYQAAADPVVRAGTNGLIYYNGLVFDRGDNGKSAIFLARFIDRNNKENGDPVAYLGTSTVVASTGAAFLDKPWMAVDIPRGNAGQCVVGGTPNGGNVRRNGHRRRGRGNGHGNPPPDDGLDRVPAGAVYVVYSSITGEDSTLRSEIFLKRSTDCGASWSPAIRVSRTADAINQGATLAIDPQTGHVYVAWRRFGTPTDPDADAIMIARLPHGGSAFDPPGRARGFRRNGAVSAALDRIFEHRKKRAHPTEAASLSEVDQGTTSFRFRTNAYPTMAIDGARRVYVAWAERGFAAARPDPVDGDARILVTTTMDAKTFTTPVVVDDNAPLGHQLMPSLAFAGGKLMLVFYDLRETAAQVFARFVSDSDSTNGLRHTIDIRAAMGTPGATPSFAPSVRVSDYLMGYRSPTAALEQLQVNPPNLPLFKLGTAPFIGDYIDIAPAPAFVPTGNGGWTYNTASSSQLPVFHAVWTDNRDVRPPLDNNWSNYTPPTIPGLTPGDPSLFDPTQTLAVCQPGNAGSRNQNVYTARIGGGLLVGAPGNTKPLSTTVQRGFVVFAQNQTTVTKTFRMTVLAQPPGGRASFDQFPQPPYPPSSPPPKTTLDVRVPPRSTAARTVYVTSSDPMAQLNVDVSEVTGVGGPVISGGLAGRVVINPDIENPDIENPDIENPDIENPDIENAEVYNPDIENPDIENPDIENPDIENPDIENPDIENVVVANPDIQNLTVANPDIENPDIENPDIENPDIENPDIENGAVSDVTWTVSNIGNTTAAFNVNLFLANAGVPAGVTTQLIVYKTYKTPVVSNGCELKAETRNVMLFSVPSPNFVTPGEGLPDQNDPSDTNATLWLSPGELGRVTLRVYDNDKSNNIIVTNLDGSTASIDPIFNPTTQVTAGISGQGVDVLDPPGATEPPVVTTTGTNLVFLQQPTNTEPGEVIAPPVSVRIWSNSGAPLPGVIVTMELLNGAVGAVLTGNTAATDASGIATFGALSVDIASLGVSLRATATTPGVIAAGTSVPFDVATPGGPATVTITDWSAIYDGTPKSVTVNTDPPGLAVSVSYNESPTPPSAIGAYYVQAIVTEPGFTGAATAVHKIASTIAAGGYGGGPFHVSCGPGVFANGFRVDPAVNYGVEAGQLLCNDNNNPLQFGDGAATSDLLCPSGQNMVGFFGTTDALFPALGYPVVTRMGPRCQLPTGGAITEVGPLPTDTTFGGNVPYTIDCPAGQAVTGVLGGTGDVVDSVALVCGDVSAAPTIASATPSPIAAGFGQMIVLRGTNMPGTNASGILFNQGGPDMPAHYANTATSTLVIARASLDLVPGPATVRSTDGFTSTPAFPITISAVPGAPVLAALRSGCGVADPDITSVIGGNQVFVLADGVDTSGTTFVWTSNDFDTEFSATDYTTGGPGSVCTATTVPALQSGSWTLHITVNVNGNDSAPSNAIEVTVPFLVQD